MQAPKVFPREAYESQGYEEGDGIGYRYYPSTPQEWWRGTLLIKRIFDTKRRVPIAYTQEQFNQVITIQAYRIREIMTHEYVQEKKEFVSVATDGTAGIGEMQIVAIATLVMLKMIAGIPNYNNYLAIIDQIFCDKPIEPVSKAYLLRWLISNNETIIRYANGIRSMCRL